jgi:hypothetical protein
LPKSAPPVACCRPSNSLDDFVKHPTLALRFTSLSLRRTMSTPM